MNDAIVKNQTHTHTHTHTHKKAILLLTFSVFNKPLIDLIN